MKQFIISNKHKIAFVIIFILCFIFIQYKNFYKNNNSNTIKIACGNDVTGMLFNYIIKEKKSNIEISNFDYIEFLDCCGSQAEFAFISGKVDMAILCTDAALELIDANTNYNIVDSIVKGSNVLVYYDEKYDINEPKNIGYMHKRLLQQALLKKEYLNSNFYPMMPIALPYALEKKNVDAIFLDIIMALKIKNARLKRIDTDNADYYLVINNKLKDSNILNDFINTYNEAVDDINNDAILSNMLINYLDILNIKGEVDIWKKMNIRFSKIKAEL